MIIDQIGRKLDLHGIPQRIISVVPSITELLCDFGLTDNIVGVTKFCVHPKSIRQNVATIGGTKNINIERVVKLNPDIIFANKEENSQDQINKLEKEHSVFVSDIKSHKDALSFISHLGTIFKKPEFAKELIHKLDRVYTDISGSNTGQSSSVAYLIWRNPFMTIGGDTYISSMLEHMGFKNVFSDEKRYPQVDLDTLKDLKIDYIFLSSEPYPFNSSHQLEIEDYTGKKTVLVDGEFFSWYGSRLLHMEGYFKQLTSQL